MPHHPTRWRGAQGAFVALAVLALAALVNIELFRVPLPRTVQPPELLWVEFSLIGLSYQTRGLADALLDYSSLKRDGRNGARKIVALSGIRNQTNACVMHLLFLSIGVVAMTQAPVSAKPVTVTSLVLTGVLFAANGILVANAIMQRRSRAKLEAYLARTEGTLAAVSRDEGAP